MIILLSGCGSDNPSVRNSDRGTVVTIAMLTIPNDEAIARTWYAEELEEKLGVKVVLLNYDSGMLANNAIATGNVDIALVGTAAAAEGLAKGMPYEVFWIHSLDGENESLAVKNNSGINSIADLKGKRIGVPPASTAQYSLLNAIHAAGLNDNDVILIFTQPSEIVRNWNAGKLDAAFVWQPYLGRLLDDDGHVLISCRQLDKQGITTADIGVVNRDFARAHPEIVRKYVELQARAQKFYSLQPHKAAAVAAIELGLSEENALKQMEEIVWITAENQLSDRYLGSTKRKGRMVQTLMDTAQFLQHNGAIDNAGNFDVFNKAVNPAFVEAVVNKH